MSDYCPPGLGRDMENLISKHSQGLTAKRSSIYEWAVRNADRTRALLAKMGATPPPPPEPPRKPRVMLDNGHRPSPGKGLGKKAYEWGIANNLTCKEAALAFGTTVSAVQSYRINAGLPGLRDGRVNTGDYKRHRRKAAEIRAACAAAVAEMRRSKQSIYTVCKRSDISVQSVIRHCRHEGITWNK